MATTLTTSEIPESFKGALSNERYLTSLKYIYMCTCSDPKRGDYLVSTIGARGDPTQAFIISISLYLG